MDLLDWLTGSDTETYSSAKPPEFLGAQESIPETSLQSQRSTVQSTEVESRRESSEKLPKAAPQYSLTPLESRIKNIILSVYSNKWIGEESSESPEESSVRLTPTPDEEHKRLHSVSSTDGQPSLRLNLDDSIRETDLSVELVKDEEESQTLGLGRLTTLLPSSVLRAGPVGGESLKLDTSCARVPPHIRRPDSPKKSGRTESPKLPLNVELKFERELISRLAPEGISDSDTDLPKVVASSSNLLTRLQKKEKEESDTEDRPSSKMSDVKSITSASSFAGDEITSIPFFSADDLTVNPSDSEISQVVPSSMHQDEVPYASFYASSRNAATPNIPSALRPTGSDATTFGTDDPDLNVGLLYSFTDSSYKSKLSRGSGKTKPRSQVVESFGMSMGDFQLSHTKPPMSVPHQPTPVQPKKTMSVGDDSEGVRPFPKPRFVSESDQYPPNDTEPKTDTGINGGGGDSSGGGEESEKEERNSSTPVFEDTNDTDLSKEATPVPDLASTSSHLESIPPPAGGTDIMSEYTHPLSRVSQDPMRVDPTHFSGDLREDITESPLMHQHTQVLDKAPGSLDFTDGGDPTRYGEPHYTMKEAKYSPSSKASEDIQVKRETLQPLGLDPPSYRVSRLDSDIETSSVVSVQELTETLLNERSTPLNSLGDHMTPPNPTDGKVPFSLPLVQPQAQEHATSTVTSHPTSLPSRHMPTAPGLAKPCTPTSKHTPPALPSSLQLGSKLPQHLQPSPKLQPKRATPLSAWHTRESSPRSEISEQSSSLVQPFEGVAQIPKESERPVTSSVRGQASEPGKETVADESIQSQLESLEEELTKALQERANLEGQLESVTEECKMTMKDRAGLQSRLAKAEAELAEMSEALDKEREKTAAGVPRQMPPVLDKDTRDTGEDLLRAKSELESEKEKVAGLKNEIAKEKQNSRKLHSNLDWTKQSLGEQQAIAAELKDRVKDLQSTVEQKSSDQEEAEAKLSSLEASYGALQGTKDWLHGQLENTLEEKKKLQEEWRDSKANVIAQTMRAEQLLKENSTLQQQVAELQQGILQDKAKLVNELEAIEADVLSREDSYSHLVTEKAQLEDAVKRLGETLKKVNSDMARAHVENEELEKKMEDSEMQNDVLTHKVEDLERQNGALTKKLHLAEQEVDARSSDMKEMEKARASLQERLKQVDAALVSKDGTCQGLSDANEILKHELEAVKQDRDKLEEELDKTKEEMAALEADLKLANDSNVGKDSEMKSLTHLREASTAESQALKEKLEEKERELEEKANELEALEAQSGELLEQFKTLQDRFQTIAADTGSVHDSVAEKDRVIAHLVSEKDRAEQELSSLKEETEQLSNRVSQLEHDNARLEGEVEATSSGNLEEYQKAVQDKAQLQAELNSLRLGQQHESIRAETKASRLESELKAIKKGTEKAKKEFQASLQEKEEEIRKIREEKAQAESALRDWKTRFDSVQREKERLQTNIGTPKPGSGGLDTLKTRCEQLAQQNQTLNERLQQEAAQRAEIERASGMVAKKLKQNAKEEEKKLQRQIRDLSLETERLRGRLNGMSTTQSALREHAASLEAALAKRESLLVKLSAQAQKVLEEKELEDQAFSAQIAALEKKMEDTTREKKSWQKEAQNEKKKVEDLSHHISQKEVEFADLKSLLEQTSQSGRSIPVLEEKIAELAVEKDDLISQINGLKTQLTVARTAVDIAKKDLTDRTSQVDILKKELDMAKSQRTQAERDVRQLQERLEGAESRHHGEVGKLREALQRVRESSVMEDRDLETKSGLSEMSLSSIATEEVDKPQSGRCTCTCMHTFVIAY